LAVFDFIKNETAGDKKHVPKNIRIERGLMKSAKNKTAQSLPYMVGYIVKALSYTEILHSSLKTLATMCYIK